MSLLSSETPEAYKEFLRGLGQAVKSNPDAYKELLAIDAGAGTASRTAFINNEKKREMTVKVGVETEVTLADGRTAKVRHCCMGEGRGVISTIMLSF